MEPHFHGVAAISGARMIDLARRRGDLGAGLRALGLGHLPLDQAVAEARERLAIAQPDFMEAYRNIAQFRGAAFPGARYAHWARAAVRAMRAGARTTYATLRPDDAATFLDTAATERIDLGGVRVLAQVYRRPMAEPATLAALLARKHVWGIDIVGAETERQDVGAFHQVLDLLLASRRRYPMLRIHAGEGFQGEHGEDNVNIVLHELERRSRTDPELRRVRIVLAHVARVRDVGAASSDLALLRGRGVKVEVNLNPLSNLLYGAVDHVGDIAALELRGARVIPGSDNVGGLGANAEIVDRLRRGDLAGAQRRARTAARRLPAARDTDLPYQKP